MTRFIAAAFLVMSAAWAAEARVEPILELSRHAVGPVLSPDGRYVAFTAQSDGGYGLEVVKVSDSERAPFHFTGLSGSPNWSPSGRFIAYVRTIPRDRRSLVVVRDLETHNERELGLSGFPGHTPWSQDERYLAFTDPGLHVVVYSVESGRLIQRLALGSAQNFAISPDTKRVAYSTGGSVYIGRVEPNFAATAIQVAQETLPIGQILWMPDSRTVLYEFPPGSYRRAGLGRKPSAVIETAKTLRISQIQGNGSVIAEELSASPGNLHWATTEVTYSPDKKKQAYITTRWTGKEELHIANRDGSGDRLIAAESMCTSPPFRELYYVAQLEWSPDSGFLTFRCSCRLPANALSGSVVGSGYVAPVNGGPLSRQPSNFDTVKTERIVPDRRQDRHRLVRVLLPPD